MRIAGIILIVLGLGVFAYWGATGAPFVTQYQVAKTTVEEDDFGDQVEKTEMVDEFRFGLMPDKGLDGALPLGGVPIGLGVALLIGGVLLKRKQS